MKLYVGQPVPTLGGPAIRNADTISDCYAIQSGLIATNARFGKHANSSSIAAS
jgi:hypothetical protein